MTVNDKGWLGLETRILDASSAHVSVRALDFLQLELFKHFRMAMSPEQPNDPTTRLLTLLNVSALKRKRPVEQELEFTPAAKLNKRKSVQFNSVHAGPSGSQNVLETQDTTSEVELANDNDVEGELQCQATL